MLPREVRCPPRGNVDVMRIPTTRHSRIYLAMSSLSNCDEQNVPPHVAGRQSHPYNEVAPMLKRTISSASQFRSSLPTALAIAWLLAGPPCWGAAPTIYSTPAYQSPVRADPDDLLLLPGIGFAGGDTVVYRAITDTTAELVPPDSVPRNSSETLGVADVVSVVDAPFSLTIHLPSVIKTDQSYALWVVTPLGEWSNGVKINDARPLWITPNEVYSSEPYASLPRTLKVVGRNLQPASSSHTRVRLTGQSTTYTLPAATHAAPRSAIDRYVARIQLPTTMAAGTYSVQLSRDGVSWVPVFDANKKTDGVLTVLADPQAPATFPVGSYTLGTCIPGPKSCSAVRGKCTRAAKDNYDATPCIVAAIAAAHAAGGGVVVFDAGVWNLTDPGSWASGPGFSNKGVSYDGILVPDGVSLRGAGSAATSLVRGADWNIEIPTFALQGHNAVSGFTFRDMRLYTNADSGTTFLGLGVRLDRMKNYEPDNPIYVSHVVITKNVFDKPFRALANRGQAIDHLFITKNVFGAFRTALSLEGNPSNTGYRYHYSDSVVAYNTFIPGSYLDTAIGQGTIATELSGGYRTDFSNNVADGSSTAYLYNPETDARGWRAGHFWTMHDNVEMMLVSQNAATCTGDKDGDGEAIAYDNNHNRPGFASLAQRVLSATSNPSAGTSAITGQGSLNETRLISGTSINVGSVSSYYTGDWLQVVEGPGIGQARKVTAISTGSGAGAQTVTFTVAPAFDVLPQVGSLVTDGRLFWQSYTVGNIIDHRTPLCRKSNRTRQAGGQITVYAQTADSVIEGNSQFDTSGIFLAHKFERSDAAVNRPIPDALVQSFNEVRDNLVSGAFNDNDTSAEAQYGIALGYAATPHTAPPPTLSYGIAVSHNSVNRAGASAGAISLNQSWFAGPVSRILPGVTPWKIADATLLFKNTLTDIGQPGATRVGIGISAGRPTAPVEWRSVLYGNVCNGTSLPDSGLVDMGTGSVLYCPSRTAKSCECNKSPTDLSIETARGSISATVGSAVTYTLLVSNNGPTVATGSVLSIELPPGLTVSSIAGTRGICDIADANVNLCYLGNIAARATVRVDVVVTIDAIGVVKTVFSVTHHEADTNASNNSVGVVTIGSSANARTGAATVD